EGIAALRCQCSLWTKLAISDYMSCFGKSDFDRGENAMSVRLNRSGLRRRDVVHGLSTLVELSRGRKLLALPAIAAMVLAPARVALAQSLAPVWGISTVAGTGATTGVDTGDGGPAVSATIGKPYQVVVDAAGKIYFGAPR